MIRIASLCTMISFLFGCRVEPVPIEYHVDQCVYCKMGIADSKFGAELVTKKGKVYKFDAIECLIPTMLEEGEDMYAHIMVTDFLDPGKLIDAKKASFLISLSVPSPMGGNLSAYSNEQRAKTRLGASEGQLLTWSELTEHFNGAH